MSVIKVWTVDTIKRELPDIDVLLNGKRKKCRIVGRMDDFATLSISTQGIPIGFMVAWSTLVRVLNNGSAVRV